MKAVVTEVSNVLDLSNLDITDTSAEGVWLNPRDLEGNPLALEILVYGEDSRQYVSAMDRISRARKTRSKGRRNNAASDVDYSEIKEASWILASRLTGGFRHAESKQAIPEITVKGHVHDVAKVGDLEALYQRLTDLADQVVSFSRDQSNFLRR